MARLLRRLLIVCLILLLPLVVAYAAFPVVVPWLLDREAAALGLSVLDVRPERPDLHGMHVRAFRAESPAFALDLVDMQLTWDLSSLRRGRLLRLGAAEGSLTVLSNPTRSPHDAGSMPGEGGVVSQNLFGLLPFDAAHVDNLHFALPALAASARGSLDFETDELSLVLEGLSPEQAEGLVLDARISGSGGIALSLEPAGGDEPPFLNVRSSLPKARLDMDVDARLSGFALDLVSTLAGIPEGGGLVTAAWQLSLPWPLATGAWQTLSGGGPIRVDWRSADDGIRMTGLEGTVELASGSLAADLTGTVEMSLNGTRIVLRPSSGRLVPLPLKLDTRGNLEILREGLHFGGDSVLSISRTGAGSYDTSAELDGVLSGENLRLPITLRGSWLLSGDGAKGRSTVSSGQFKAVPFDLEYLSRRQRAEIRIDHPVSFSKPLLRGIWPSWREDYDLDGGTLALAVNLVAEIGKSLTGSGTVGLTGVSAHAGPAVIRGLSGPLNVALGEDGLYLQPSALSAALVDFGVPLQNVEVDVSGSASALEVTTATALLLGGRAIAAPFTMSLPEAAAVTSVTLEDLDLARVLALEGEHITGTGRLDGTLPIRFSDGQISVTDGHLATRPPGGEIHLQPGIARAITQPGLDMALSALTDFRYSLLEAAVDYSPQGDLVLGVRLEGRNPAVEHGRPIHFNLNVSENIPVLLESLRLKDEFAERIERKVQR